MSRQTFSNAWRLFFGPVAYAGAYEGKRGAPMTPTLVYSFAPAAAVTAGVCASQSVGAGADALLNGSLASGGSVTFDVPRNLTLAWTTASTITIRGTDQYGRAITETAATPGGSATLKAFKTVTRSTSSASITVLIVGSGVVFGLPVAVGPSGVLAARFNSAIDAGTFVPADAATATATTGDVRGTFD